MKSEHMGTDAEQALRVFERRVDGMAPDKVDIIAMEEEIRALLDARGREVMVDVLKRADTTASEVEIAGQRWGNRRVHRGEYSTVFGPVTVERSVYQRSGRGRVAVPLDLRLGIVEGRYTPKMARILTRGIAVMTEQDAAEFLEEIGTAKMSSSTFSRIPRAIAARYEARRDVIEVNLRERDEIPEEAVTVQVALDGVMVPQDGEHARPRGRKTDSPEPPRYESRYGSVGKECPANDDGNGGRAWHEASVATLAYFDAEGARLKTVYHARMPEPRKATLVGLLEGELLAALAEKPTLNVVFASDGQASQWAALDEMSERIPSHCGGHQMHLIDAFHVFEYLHKAADAIKGPGTGAAIALAATWRATVKEMDGGAMSVLRSMRAHRSGVTSESKLEALDAAITYVANQSDRRRMNYAEAKRRNYPIGTGITEAAAKTLVSTRMKRAGARFSQHGGQTVLLFRAAIRSDRFDALHEELGATYRKDPRIAA